MTSDVIKKLLPFYEEKMGCAFEWKEWVDIDLDEPKQKCMPLDEWDSFQEKLKAAESKPSVSDVLADLKSKLEKVNEETIPKERNTTFGAKVWQNEQNAKIRDLKAAISLLTS
jgi:hypothetical protein